MNDNKLVIKNIHFGKGNKAEFLYAELHGEKGLLVSATLDYIVRLLTERENNIALAILGIGANDGH